MYINCDAKLYYCLLVVLYFVYTVGGKILVGQNIGEWNNPNQLEGKILANELHG